MFSKGRRNDMTPEPGTWHWGSFLIYCLGCFCAALVTGLLGMPGMVVVAVAAMIGLWAALGRWFEVR
jgi:hypothetical protein